MKYRVTSKKRLEADNGRILHRFPFSSLKEAEYCAIDMSIDCYAGNDSDWWCVIADDIMNPMPTGNKYINGKLITEKKNSI